MSTITSKLINSGLPTKLPEMDPAELLEKMKLDKKNTRGEINFTLIKSIGEGIINQTITENEIKKVLTKS